MNREQDEAALCLGFRTWAAQSVPLDVHKGPNNKVGFLSVGWRLFQLENLDDLRADRFFQFLVSCISTMCEIPSQKRSYNFVC